MAGVRTRHHGAMQSGDTIVTTWSTMAGAGAELGVLEARPHGEPAGTVLMIHENRGMVPYMVAVAEELAIEAAQRKPGIKVLYMSGYTGSAIAQHGRLDAELLQKPFRKDVFARALRRALDS